jgi:hypothetical protein
MIKRRKVLIARAVAATILMLPLIVIGPSPPPHIYNGISPDTPLQYAATASCTSGSDHNVSMSS